jgi:teichuronic acid biosynthesis glycosyltransferase TuaG
MTIPPPLISVVMPVYNAEKYLRKSVDSVLQQSYSRLELVIVDDCSDDRSWQLIGEYTADPRVITIQQERNGGVAAARNAGLAVARGGYVAFLDSDDWWHPRKLELQLAYMRETGARVSYAAYDRVTPEGEVLSRVRPWASVEYRDMLKSNHIGHLTGMYDRSLGAAAFQPVGHEDYVFWLELVRRAGRAICVAGTEPLAWYLVRNGSVSANKMRAALWQWRIYRNVEKLGWLTAAMYMVHYAAHAMRKRN